MAGLDTANILSQCYDGASVMAGQYGGVQKILQQRLRKTIPYIHCYNHRLHLVVVSSTSCKQKVQQLLTYVIVYTDSPNDQTLITLRYSSSLAVLSRSVLCTILEYCLIVTYHEASCFKSCRYVLLSTTSVTTAKTSGRQEGVGSVRL